MNRLVRFAVLATGLVAAVATLAVSPNPEAEVRAFVESHCVKCHGGEKVKGKVDFTKLLAEGRDLAEDFEIWDKVRDALEGGDMPPEEVEEEARPTAADLATFGQWYQLRFVDSVKAAPGEFRARRLSVVEFRHSLRSLLGFDLKVAIREAEQTMAETSLVMKLMPTDPPGASGFTNDTGGNPLTTVAWERYAFLIDAGLAELFSSVRRKQLETYVGVLPESGLPTPEQAVRMVRAFIPKAWRRPVPEEKLRSYLEALKGLEGKPLVDALRGELKAAMLSPAFLYRGLLAEVKPGGVGPVDAHELAERLSYFLWADMPDAELMDLAEAGKLTEPEALASQVNRLLNDPRSRSLAEVFATQWLSLEQVAAGNVNPHKAHAFKSQPLDFVDYLFREDRPLTELIDSRVAFANPHTQGYYPGDNRGLGRFAKPRGIEQKAFQNRKLQLEKVKERGGLLTIPGVLAMNRGPVTRGVWILERILGDHLGEPPPDVGSIPSTGPGGKKLTFRERFALHRSKAACAVCHDKIDPLGFALQAYDNGGGFRRNVPKADTSGRLPTGETFEDFQGLKKILVTSRKGDFVRNLVERVMAYALCRKPGLHDRPTIEAIARRLDEGDGTYRELVIEVVNSLSFLQASYPEQGAAP